MPKLLLFILFSIVAFAQEQPFEFSMQQAIEYALKNNRSALDSQSDVRFAQLQKWETTAAGLPQINADFSYNNWIEQQISLIPAEFFGGLPGEFLEVAFGL